MTNTALLATPAVPIPVSGSEVLDWVRSNATTIGIVVGLVVGLYLYRRVRAAIRRRRPPTFHPKLQPYAEGLTSLDVDLVARRRAEASRIVASSSTGAIAGYEVIEQVEAVFVDGFRRPEDALEGLKASAAMKGANALLNVRHERGPSGKCAAAGDAVIVRRAGGAAERAPASRNSSDAPSAPRASAPSDQS